MNLQWSGMADGKLFFLHLEVELWWNCSPHHHPQQRPRQHPQWQNLKWEDWHPWILILRCLGGWQHHYLHMTMTMVVFFSSMLELFAALPSETPSATGGKSNALSVILALAGSREGGKGGLCCLPLLLKISYCKLTCHFFFTMLLQKREGRSGCWTSDLVQICYLTNSRALKMMVMSDSA